MLQSAKELGYTPNALARSLRSNQTRTLALAERPTALFACNNFLAIGALKALRQAGLTVPGDISVAAFDDLPAAILRRQSTQPIGVSDD